MDLRPPVTKKPTGCQGKMSEAAFFNSTWKHMHLQVSSFIVSSTLLNISLSNIGPQKPSFTELKPRNLLHTWKGSFPPAQTELEQIKRRHSLFQLFLTGNISKGSEIAYLLSSVLSGPFPVNFGILRLQDRP